MTYFIMCHYVTDELLLNSSSLLVIMGSLKSSNVYNLSIITEKERKVREPFTLIITYIV